MSRSVKYFLIVGCAAGMFSACTKEADLPAGNRVPILPEISYRYDELPEGYVPQLFGQDPFGSVPLNNEKATLGRVLFYETQLSVNNTRSCGTCHHQARAFADNAAFSEGFNGGMTLRNVPPISNAGTQNAYFWDMRETNLQEMVTQPVANHIEMGIEEPEYMVAKIASLPYYEALFKQAYGDGEVTSSRIGESLSHFVRSILSLRSRFDEGSSLTFANFSPQEERGRQLFFNELPCAQCHGGEHFNGWGSNAQNIGLETDYSDDGIPGTDWNTGKPMDGWFKVPSLRNVELTAPYMHDGRFASLEEVVEFYNSGIQPHEQLSFSLREGWNGMFIDFPVLPPGGPGETSNGPLRMQLSSSDKAALVAFLRTLTDRKLVGEKKFSDPFVMPDSADQ
jgi:cytochrome c peroxidase